jgi:uncharacterized membrane protein
VVTLRYNDIAGRGLERLAALSDGVFAVAMTLLILEIHVPSPGAVASDGQLWAALASLAPRFLTYFLSFMTLGIFWGGQQTQLNQFSRGTRDLAWIHIAFLALVVLMPFTTSLLAEFITLRLALLLYWANIFVLGLVLFLSWTYAVRAGIVKDDRDHHIGQAIKRRILVAQALYGFGALLSLLNPYWSIGFIIAVQLNFAIGPRIRFLSRL